MEFYQEVIVSLATVLLTLFGTEWFSKKKTLEDRRVQLQYQFLTQSLELLNRLDIELYAYTREAGNCLRRKIIIERKPEADEIIGRASLINESMLAICTSQKQINNSIGIDLDLQSLQNSVGGYVDDVNGLLKKYIRNPDTSGFFEGVAPLEKKVHESVGKCSRYIANEISEILK